MTVDMSTLTKRVRAVLAPLEPETERRAVEAALACRSEARKDFRVRGTELVIAKGRRGERPLRYVRVLLTRHAESSVYELLVGEHGQVIADRDLGARNLPFLYDEVMQARAVAEREPQVAPRIAGSKVGVGTFAPMLETVRRTGHRLVGLHFLDVSNPDAPRPLVSVVVDLATSHLVRDTDHHHREREA